MLVAFPVACVATASHGHLRPVGHSHGGLRHEGSKGSILRTKLEQHMHTHSSAQVDHGRAAATPVTQQAVHTPGVEAALQTAHSPRSVASQMPTMINPSGTDIYAEQASSGSSSSAEAASQLQRELIEAKQRRANIVQLEKVLTVDTALVREGSSLESVSTSARARADAEKEVRKSKQFIQEVSAMLRQSRADAAREAHQALSDARAARAAAEELSAEAANQLRALAPSTDTQTAETPAGPESQIPVQATAAAATTAGAVTAAAPTATMMSSAASAPPLPQGRQSSDIDDLEDDP